MHVHELNPWRTLIALSAFVIIVIVGFVTMQKPLLTYELDMKQSVEETKSDEYRFHPWQLNGFINKETKDVVVFDIRDNFVFGQGHIPGAENISAQDLVTEENIERLKELKANNITAVLYGEDQLQANGPVMLFRQVGFDNVKVLIGGYQYYLLHQDDLVSTKDDSTLLTETPGYNYSEMAAPQDGSSLNSKTEKKKVTIIRREKSKVAAGGC